MKTARVLNFALAAALVVVSGKLAVNSIGSKKQEAETKDEQVAEKGGELKEFDITKELDCNPFTFFRGHGLLLCAGDKSGSNAMTIGWGALGTNWGVPAVTVYVRKGRYTHQFMEKGRYFTVMKFADNKIVDYMGTHSGRDGDKAEALGLTLEYTKNGAPYYKEAEMVIECRTMSASDFTMEELRDDTPRRIYTDGSDDGGLHTEYIGEVVGAMKR